MRLETHEVPARLLQHPTSDGNNQRGLLGEADETLRWDHSELSVPPAEKRFETRDVTGSEAHDRLIVKSELTSIECAAQIAFELDLVDSPLRYIVFGVEGYGFERSVSRMPKESLLVPKSIEDDPEQKFQDRLGRFHA